MLSARLSPWIRPTDRTKTNWETSTLQTNAFEKARAAYEKAIQLDSEECPVSPQPLIGSPTLGKSGRSCTAETEFLSNSCPRDRVQIEDGRWT